MSNLINKQAVRRLALIIANEKHTDVGLPDSYADATGRQWNYTGAKKSYRGRKYRQVSAAFLEHMDSLVKVSISNYIDKMDNNGSTIK